MAGYAHVDEAAARFRADAIRQGQIPGALSPDLLELRRRQQAAREEAADAEAAHLVLDGEAREAQATADAAEAELRAEIEKVCQGEFDRAAGELQAAEIGLAMRRLELGAFVNGTTSLWVRWCYPCWNSPERIG